MYSQSHSGWLYLIDKYSAVPSLLTLSAASLLDEILRNTALAKPEALE